jgi:uracil-DNA glycosylase family 4
MNDSTKVLNRSVGLLGADLMFIGEAPGRLGADKSAIPFHGDKAGHNFESLLDYAGIDRSQIFVTNAVLCNPRAEDGNNSTPTAQEIDNCSDKLARQIELVDPAIIVTLGATALTALGYISTHDLQLRRDVKKLVAWNGRKLIPLYHPGQRAMIHRSFANQCADYQYIRDVLKARTSRKNKSPTPTKYDVATVAKELIKAKGVISYFALHKLYYLLEYKYGQRTGSKLSKAFFVRQKDGPYCTDLHLLKLKGAIPNLQISKRDGQLLLSLSDDMFSPESARIAEREINQTLEGYMKLTDDKLKTASYMTRPMRRILREERRGINMMNAPIEIASK